MSRTRSSFQLRRSMAAHLRFAVFGHTEGSYSLAAINRTVAAAIEAERPGRVRLLPVEGRATHLRGADAALARARVGWGEEIDNGRR